MSEFDLKIRSRDIKTLLDQIKKNDPKVNIDIVNKAYEFAESAHRGQLRYSGEPYITHPLEVAITLAILKLDTTTISAALLHDVVEDTQTTIEILKNKFNGELAQLVDGVTKISSIKNKSKFSAQAEYLRKMLIATIKDVRVIIIKLADKLHNMRTIMFQDEEKRKTIAKETLDIYAPIARRLGMSMICSELEDISFHVLFPDEYNRIRDSFSERKTELDSYFDNIKAVLIESFKKFSIETEITGRAKHYYSIYRKMKFQNKDFDSIYDIRAVRIITRDIKDCYAVLGVVHSLWSPITSRFKDYIAVPKSNMYQSLHTTVIGPDGHRLEVQIRTQDMHATAEMGIAAHWLYKEKNLSIGKNYKELTILENINKQFDNTTDIREFMRDLKMDLYEDEIFVFTPKGKIVKLSKESSPIDFAYAIHTEVGEHTTGAMVNKKIVPLRTRLKSGDIIEILTSKNGHPSESWLKLVRSTKARYKIRSWLRKNIEKHPSEETGLKSRREKSKKQEKTVQVTIPVNEHKKLNKMSKKTVPGLSIAGTSNVEIRLSQCCQPIPGDDVIGFITRGRGMTIHKKTCPSLKRLKDESERFIEVVWEGNETEYYPVKIAVFGLDRANLLKDVTDQISLTKTNILKMEANVKDDKTAEIKFILEVKSNTHLNEIMQMIKKIGNITDIYKLNEKVVLNKK